MTNYGWTETENYYIQVVRPEVLFDLSTLKYPEPGRKTGDVTAIHRLTQQRETYALAYGKGHNLKLLKMRRNTTEPWLDRDRADQARLLPIKT